MEKDGGLNREAVLRMAKFLSGLRNCSAFGGGDAGPKKEA